MDRSRALQLESISSILACVAPDSWQRARSAWGLRMGLPHDLSSSAVHLDLIRCAADLLVRIAARGDPGTELCAPAVATPGMLGARPTLRPADALECVAIFDPLSEQIEALVLLLAYAFARRRQLIDVAATVANGVFRIA